jgi:hypothetical protein
VKLGAATAVLVSGIVAALLMAAPTTASAQTIQGYEIMAVTVTSTGAPARSTSTVRAAGPEGEVLLCDKFYAFADDAGEFTLQHQCGGNTAPWGYRIAGPLRAIAVTPVTEQGLDWTRNGVRQPRMSPHVEGADYIFHGTFPNSPDGTAITYEDHYSYRHGMDGGGDVNISVKGEFTLTGNRA